MYSDCVWNFSLKDPVIYLSFDDGPHPVATPFVLDLLKQFNAKATFFCIGKNVALYPAVYKRILTEGHRTGNHTFNHINGWKHTDEEYIKDVAEARKYIDSKLFRPPYGKITKFQVKLLMGLQNTKQDVLFKVIMWDVLSADFDESISAEKCTSNVIKNAGPGSIIVFHDSEKAFPRMQSALRETLKFFTNKGYSFQSIS